MQKRIKSLFIIAISLMLMLVCSLSPLAETVSTQTAPTPKSFSISAASYAYTGKAIRPKVTVKQGNGAVISPKYYTVYYTKNVNIGRAIITVKMKNSSFYKCLYFNIVPKKAGTPAVSSVKQKTFTVTVSEDLNSTGYLIRYSTSKSFKTYKDSILAVNMNVRKTFKVAKNGTYYVKVRNYKMVSRKRVYGAWSSTVKVSVKAASPNANLPTAMMESYVADSLTYLGYKTAKHRAMGSYLCDVASGPRTPLSVRSGIKYGGVPSGQETVKSKSTVTGKAPNVKYFKKYGMCCASFVSYYYLNYLPNVVGIDTKFIKNAIDKSGYKSRVCESWEFAAKYLVKQGKATVVDKVPKGSTLKAAHLEKLEIGDLITFRIPSSGRSCGHVAVYAGKNHQGDHFVAHVGSDEGPVFQTLQRFQNVVNRADGCAYSIVYRFKGVSNSKYDYSAALKASKVKYTGKAVKPTVIVKDSLGKTMNKKYYTVHYSNNVKKGTGYARIVFKGKHKGTKLLKFKIV